MLYYVNERAHSKFTQIFFFFFEMGEFAVFRKYSTKIFL